LHESKDHDHNVLWIRSSQAKNWCHVHVWWCCPIKHCENLFNYILHQLLNKLYHIIQILSIFLWLQCLREWFWISFFKSSISNFCLKRVLVLMRSGNLLPTCSVDEFLPIKAHLNKRGRLIHHYNKYDA
jgi:hypothetical protein